MNSDKDINALCMFFSSRLRAERIRLNRSQLEMSKLCGIPLRTYKRLELSGKGTIENFIRTLVATDRVLALDLLFPDPPVKRINSMDRIAELAKAVKEKNEVLTLES